MNKKEIKSEIFAQLTPFLGEHGFKPQKGNDRFVRETKFGFHGISFHSVQRNNYCDVSFSYSIRFDAIENIVNQIITVDPKLQKGTITLLVTQKFLVGVEKDPYRIGSKNDLDNCLKSILDNDLEVATQVVFNNFNSLEKIDDLLNSIPVKSTMLLNNKEQHCYKGLITAKLVNSSKLDELDQEYLKIMEQMATHIQEKHNKLRELLQLT